MANKNNDIRYRIRRLFDLCAFSTGLLHWYERRMRKGLTILMYHRVLPFEKCQKYPLESLVMPLEAFSMQMKWIAEHCCVNTVKESLVALRTNKASTKPMVAVTFDDGYDDNYKLAAPILEDYNLKGTFFITSGFVEKKGPLWFDRAADAWMRLSPKNRSTLIEKIFQHNGHRLKGGRKDPTIKDWMDSLKSATPQIQNRFIKEAESLSDGEFDHNNYSAMSIEDLKDLHRRGHEIAAHTDTHPILTQLNNESIRGELERPKKKICDWLDIEEMGFCYPNGNFDEVVKSTIREVGYTYGCTTETGINHFSVDTMALERLPITKSRILTNGKVVDDLSFRCELSRVRELLR